MQTHGYSGTPLVRKLGLKAGMRVPLLNPSAHYWELLGGTPASLELLQKDAVADADFTHLFATERRALERGFSVARERMTEAGLVWASWPKQSSGVATEIGRADIMAAGKAAGLVDVKVCAVDDT